MLSFNPILVGQAEVGWWRAHNEKDIDRLRQLLIEEHMLLYDLDEETAKRALSPLVEATKYHDKRDWQSAVDKVAEYYEAIKNKSSLDFDPREVAELEVGWWRLHDDLEGSTDKSSLAEAFAKLYATQFGKDVEVMREAGALKAQATYEHDLAEDSNTPVSDVDNHWQKAGELLVEFYKELKSKL